MWHFLLGDLDSRNVSDPVEHTVQSHGRLTEREILVREVLQNALDNGTGQGLVTVRFRLSYLDGSDKASFLDGLGFSQITAHTKAVRDYEVQTYGNSLVRDSQGFMCDDQPLKLLVIEDFGTRGLIGPEHERESQLADGDEPCCFIGLCRNIGDSQKGRGTLGGTYGFGKTVLWKHSRLKLVMFYSRLVTPYVVPEDNVMHDRRAFGQLRLRSHSTPDGLFRGEAYFGNWSGEVTRSLYDNEADRVAGLLGVELRSANSTGTTIVVVDFDDPDVADDEETEVDTTAGIVRAAETYFWPAIEDGRLRVLADGASRVGSVEASPAARPDLGCHLRAFRSLRSGAPRETLVRQFEVEVPRGPGTEDRASGILQVGIEVPENGDMPAGMRNRAALVRGAGMVVGYWAVPRRGLSGKDFAAVVLGGQALRSNAGAQHRLEKLLAWAEPVTHDSWTENSDMLRRWWGGRAAIHRVREEIKRLVSDTTMQSERPVGSAAPILSRMFPLGSGEVSRTAREVSVQVVHPPGRLTHEGGEGQAFGFEVMVSIPAADRFTRRPRPTGWRVLCQYGFPGEGRSERLIEHARVRFTEARSDSGVWQKLSQDYALECSFEGTVSDVSQIVAIRGRTEPLLASVANIAKHKLRVKVESGAEEVSE